MQESYTSESISITQDTANDHSDYDSCSQLSPSKVLLLRIPDGGSGPVSYACTSLQDCTSVGSIRVPDGVHMHVLCIE